MLQTLEAGDWLHHSRDCQFPGAGQGPHQETSRLPRALRDARAPAEACANPSRPLWGLPAGVSHLRILPPVGARATICRGPARGGNRGSDRCGLPAVRRGTCGDQGDTVPIFVL